MKTVSVSNVANAPISLAQRVEAFRTEAEFMSGEIADLERLIEHREYSLSQTEVKQEQADDWATIKLATTKLRAYRTALRIVNALRVVGGDASCSL